MKKLANGKPKAVRDLEPCDLCPMAERDEWRLRAAQLRHELRRHKITDTERRLAESIIDLSFGQGMPSVFMPVEKWFSQFTGMEPPHISDALYSLKLNRIISVVEVKGKTTYSIREDTQNWKAAQRELMEDRDDRLNQIRALNGLPPAPKGAHDFFDDCSCAKNFGAHITRQVIRHVTKPVIIQRGTRRPAEREVAA